MSDASLTEEQEFQIFGTIPTSMRWQPIETAPRDGTIILGYLDNGDGTVFMSHIMWADKKTSFVGHSGEFVGPEAWFALYNSELVCPTHWIPFPEPPK